MYLHTGLDSILYGNGLHQSQKKKICKYVENFYAWHDVGERKLRLVESLSRVLSTIDGVIAKKTEIHNTDNES